MALLTAIQYGGQTNKPPELSVYWAQLALPNRKNWRIDAAVLTANINILRQDAPYCYLFAMAFHWKPG